MVVMVVVVGAERVREAHQPAQGASELGVRMLEYPTVHARPGCGGAEVKMQRVAVWLNMQSEKVGERREKLRGNRGGGEGEEGEIGEPRQTAVYRGHGMGCGDAVETGLCEVCHVHGSSRDVSPALSLRQPAH